jgi:preprotein translocase subunit SecE
MLQKLTNYFKNSARELKKVNWPTKKETVNNTALVIGISLGMAVFLGVIDFFLTQILQLLM